MAEIFILNIGGNVLCYYNSDAQKNENGMDGDNANPHMVASFLTGILQFAEKIHGDEINSFEMGNKSIVITSTIFTESTRIYYIILSEKKNKQNLKSLNQKLDKIRDQFESSYNVKEIENWDGDLTFFEDMVSEIRIIIDGDSRVLSKEERKKKFINLWKEKMTGLYFTD